MSGPAVIVLARPGGEGADLPKDMGVVLCSSPGATGFNFFGSVLRGTVNPSGKTVDTWLRDVTAAPTFNNVGHNAYDNVEEVAAAVKEHWERADGGYGTVEAESVGKVATLDADGPAGVNSAMTGCQGMGYCGEISLAQTWNNELAYTYAYNMLQEFMEFGFNGCSALLNDILRGKWGFVGMVLTDYFGNYSYMDADKAIRGGSDSMLGIAGNDAILTDQTSATSVIAMRNACHNIFYTIVNSHAYSAEAYAEATAMPAWQVTAFVADGVLAVVLIALEVLAVRGWQKRKAAQK